MQTIDLYNGILKNGKYCLVKTINEFSEFNDVIRVFSQPPYNEILSETDCLNEFNSYVDNGFMVGVYVNDKIAGINCILNDVPVQYSIGFSDNKRVAYYSGLAVKNEYRRLGLGKLLVSKTDEFINKQEKYDYSFARILCVGSMSEGIFKLNNFVDAYDNGELIIDEVSYLRNTGTYDKDERKYMVKKLGSNSNYYYKR